MESGQQLQKNKPFDNNTSKKFGISGSTLKMIAIVTMFIDHIGASIIEQRLLPYDQLLEAATEEQYIALMSQTDVANLFLVDGILRMIGRIAFPIFCFLLVEGFLHTRDVKKYAFRLFLFSLISEIPFDLAFNLKPLYMNYQNVFFTLFLGVIAMIGMDYVEQKMEQKRGICVILQIVITILCMAAATILKTDYSAFGVFFIALLYVLRDKKIWQTIAGCFAISFEITAPLAFLPIWFYNGKRGWNMKYFFYLFYPVHLLLLYLFGEFILPMFL